MGKHIDKKKRHVKPSRGIPARAAAAALAGMLVILLASCELPEYGQEEIHDDDKESGISVPVGAPGDDLFGVAYYPGETLDPITVKSQRNLDIMPLVFDGLFKLDENFNPIPALCESYGFEEGAMLLTLRRGVKFHDGEELTSADVVYTLSAMKKNEDCAYNARLKHVTSIFARDERIVVLTMPFVRRGMAALLDMPIVKRREKSGEAAVGTGRYEVKSDESGMSYLNANAEWYGGRVESVYRVELIPVDKNDDLISGFDSREIDILSVDINATDLISVKGEFETRKYPTSRFVYLGFNTTLAPFDNALFRRGISRAVDKDTLVTAAFSGAAVKAGLLAHPVTKAYEAVHAGNGEYDVNAAIDLLEQASVRLGDEGGMFYQDGRPVEFTILVNEENYARSEACEMIAQSLSSLGMTVTVEAVPWEEYLERLEKGEYSAFCGEVVLSPDFDFTFMLGTPETGARGIGNYTGYSNPELDALLLDFAGAGLEDGEAAARLFGFLDREMPVIPLLYKYAFCLSERGSYGEIIPTAADLFYNIEKWKVYNK